MTGPRPPRILIVDDEPLVRRSIARWIKLDFAGAVVGDAGDAQAALRMVAAERWDVVILDISMPGMSGLDALREMRLWNEDVPVVIVVSALSDTQYAAAALAAGAFAYLQKERLPQNLRTILGTFVPRLDVAAAR
jgi:DNA-binding NarL/FixJ family response regulator